LGYCLVKSIFSYSTLLLVCPFPSNTFSPNTVLLVLQSKISLSSQYTSSCCASRCTCLKSACNALHALLSRSQQVFQTCTPAIFLYETMRLHLLIPSTHPRTAAPILPIICKTLFSYSLTQLNKHCLLLYCPSAKGPSRPPHSL